MCKRDRDDGLCDIWLGKPISHIQVAGILAKYKAGRHMQDADTIVPEFRSFMTFYRARSVEMQFLDTRPIMATIAASYQHLRAHETVLDPVCRLLL